MTMSKATRREILRRASALSAVGAAASTFGVQLAAMGNGCGPDAPPTTRRWSASSCLAATTPTTLCSPPTTTAGAATGPRASRATSPIALMPVGHARRQPPGRTTPSPAASFRTTTTAYQFPEAWGGVLPIATADAEPDPARHQRIVRAPSGSTRIWRRWCRSGMPGRLAVAANVGPLIVPTTKAQYQGRQRPAAGEPDVAQRPAVDLAGRLG